MDYGLDLQWRPIFPRRIKRSSPSLYVNTSRPTRKFKIKLQTVGLNVTLDGWEVWQKKEEG